MHKKMNFVVEEEMRDTLVSFIPAGIRSEVYRSLLRLLIDTQKETNVYVCDDLIKGRLELVRKEDG